MESPILVFPFLVLQNKLVFSSCTISWDQENLILGVKFCNNLSAYSHMWNMYRTVKPTERFMSCAATPILKFRTSKTNMISSPSQRLWSYHQILSGPLELWQDPWSWGEQRYKDRSSRQIGEHQWREEEGASPVSITRSLGTLSWGYSIQVARLSSL